MIPTWYFYYRLLTVLRYDRSVVQDTLNKMKTQAAIELGWDHYCTEIFFEWLAKESVKRERIPFTLDEVLRRIKEENRKILAVMFHMEETDA